VGWNIGADYTAFLRQFKPERPLIRVGLFYLVGVKGIAVIPWG
jgi:hypothetical protein